MNEPIDDREADALLTPLAEWPRLALAISGGGDSLALMHLATRWAAHWPEPPSLHVLTVDHGLHPAAADVAASVCEKAAVLNLPCTVLRWGGEKPEAGIEEAARQARYALMADWCRAHDAALVTAHTLEDQAETVLMRLARGSGLDGLSAMRPRGHVPGAPDVPLLRPLLSVSRARLRATLRALGEEWHEDPANADARFERVRLRRAWPLLEELGLTPQQLARSAHRLRRARDALESITHGFLREHAHLHPLGWAVIDLEALLAQPDEIVLRVLARLLGALRGQAKPLRNMAGLEGLLEWLRMPEEEAGRARVLAGMRLEHRGTRLLVGREPGRIGSPKELHPVPHLETVWDGRFHVTIEELRSPATLQSLQQALEAGAMCQEDVPARPADVPAFAWRAQPTLVHAERIIALPALHWRAADAPLRAAQVRPLFPDRF